MRRMISKVMHSVLMDCFPLSKVVAAWAMREVWLDGNIKVDIHLKNEEYLKSQKISTYVCLATPATVSK